MMKDIILEVEDLHISFTTDTGGVQPVGGVTSQMGKGGSLGIVGESDCGESVVILPTMGLLENNVSRQADALFFDSEDPLKRSPKETRKIQGNRIGTIFQDPMTSLDPLFTVEGQIWEPSMRHQKFSKKEAETKAPTMLDTVGLPSSERRLRQYPHELSDGTRQGVMIAIAMYYKPEPLIVDEPTAVLGATIQVQILELIAHMKSKFNASVMLIAHDLGVVSGLCTRVIAVYRGLTMEEGGIEDTFYRAGHPYTAGFLASISKRIKERLMPVFGTPPDLLNPPKGCPSTARCSCAMKLCTVRQPPFCDLGNGHISTCWLHNGSVKTQMGEVKL